MRVPTSSSPVAPLDVEHARCAFGQVPRLNPIHLRTGAGPTLTPARCRRTCTPACERPPGTGADVSKPEYEHGHHDLAFANAEPALSI